MSLLAKPDIKSCPMSARHERHERDRAHRRATDGIDVIIPEQGNQ
jgi:hypothetical protein